MDSIGLFYGSFFGNTERAAGDIKRELERLASVKVDMKSIGRVRTEDMLAYNRLVLGISTWDIGQWQYDWEAKRKAVEKLDFSGKRVALFGMGDQVAYRSTFQDALGQLARLVQARGATLIGTWPTDGYDFDTTEPVEDGRFLGLALDNDNQDSLTPGRIAQWCRQLVIEFELPLVIGHLSLANDQ